MAIARDTVTIGSLPSGSTTSSWTHTCNGSARLLIVTLYYSNSGSGGGIAGITYNGVALTLGVSQADATADQTQIWYLVNPASGAHTVQVTWNSSVTITGQVSSISYTGVSSFEVPDATASGATPGAGTSVSVNLTTVAPKVWVFGVFNFSQTYTTWTGLTTISAAAGSFITPADSNGVVTPASTYTYSASESFSNEYLALAVMSFGELDPLTPNVTDSTAVSDSVIMQKANTFKVSDSTAVSDTPTLRIVNYSETGLLSSVTTSAYKWLTSTLLAAQQMFTVRPYLSIKVLDDTVQPNRILFASGASPAGNGAMCECPDGSIVAAGFDGSSNITFWKAANLHATNGVWDSSTVLESAVAGIENGQNRVDIKVSGYINGSYHIDVWYFTSFDAGAGSIVLVQQASDNGGATWTRRTFSGFGMTATNYSSPPSSGLFTYNLCVAAMTPRLVNGTVQSGAFYFKPWTATISTFNNQGYAGYDINYTVYNNGVSTTNKWSPNYIDSHDWTIHSLTSYYLNGKDYLIISGFRNYLDPPNQTYTWPTSVGSINGVFGNNAPNPPGGNYALWVTSLINETLSLTTDAWSPPIQIFGTLSNSFTNQNEFIFPVANVANGVVNLMFYAQTTTAYATSATGGSLVTNTTGYMLTQSTDGTNFSYPSPVVFSDGTTFTGSGGEQTWYSYANQGSYYYAGGSGVLWEFIQNNTTADVSNDVIDYTIQEAAGQPSSVNVDIGNANSKWFGASPTGVGASAIQKNRKILIEQGFYNASGTPETVPRNIYYIDDVQNQVTSSQNTLTLVGRDLYKPLKTQVTKYALQRTGPFFYTDAFDGSTLNNWSQVSGTWSESITTSANVPVANTLGNVAQSSDSIISLSGIGLPTAQWGSYMYVYFNRNVSGTTYFYPVFVDANNWLRFSILDSGSWSADVSLGGSVTNIDSGSHGFGNGFAGVFIRQYDYYKFNFIYAGNASGTGIGAWNTTQVFGSNSPADPTLEPNYGEYDLSSLFPRSLEAQWTVALGSNGGSNTDLIGTTTVGSEFQYFSYAQLRNPNSTQDLLTWMGNLAGITQYDFQNAFEDKFFNPATYTGTFSFTNRRLIVGPGNMAINNQNQQGNAEIHFSASLATTAAGGFSLLFRTSATSSPTATYYFHVLTNSDGSFSHARFERLYSGTNYIFSSSAADAAFSPQNLGGLNFNLASTNDYRVIFNAGWMYAYINNVMVVAYNDNNTTSPYLTTGYWGFQSDSNSTLKVFSVKMPSLWKLVPTFSYNPGDDLESGTDSVTQSVLGWYFSTLMGKFKGLILNSTDPSTYTYNPQLYVQSVDNSDKEYVSEVIVYGLNCQATATNTTLMAGARVRPMVVVDYTITTQQDAQTRANNVLDNANQYQNQYMPKQTMNVGGEMFDSITVINTGSNTSGVNSGSRVYAQTLREGGAADEYSIELDTGNL